MSFKQLLCLLVAVLLGVEGGKLRSKLEFDGASYRNILVALSPSINDARCGETVQQIQNVLREVSSLLHQATQGRAYFGQVNILLPRDKCLNVGSFVDPATASDSFDVSDFKLVPSGGHPFAANLPWTRQYKGCGEGGDDVFIPVETFLLSPLFSSAEKSRLLLHEWAKFRYGVFEEYGYFQDETYPACYSHGGNQGFTSCSEADLPPMENDVECRTSVEDKAEEIRQLLNSGPGSSLMFAPQLASATQFCTNENHNKHANTKHNVHCARRSVGDVIDSHPDFSGGGGGPFTNASQVPLTQFQLLRHNEMGGSGHAPGYIFAIEDSSLIRQENRMRYIKQAFTAIVDLLPLRTRVGRLFFAGEDIVNAPKFWPLDTEDDKRTLVDALPDVDTTPAFSNTTLQDPGANNVELILDTILKELTGDRKWHIYLVTNAPSTRISNSVGLLSNRLATLTVVTFEYLPNPEWTSLYASPNMKNLITLPTCAGQRGALACSRMSMELLVSDFLDTIRSQHEPRYIHKFVGNTVSPGTRKVVTVDVASSQVTMSHFYISSFVSLLDRPNSVQVISPEGGMCDVNPLQGYPYMAKVACGIHNGGWTVDLTTLRQDEGTDSTISIFVEEPLLNLKMTCAFGNDRVGEVRADQPVPVYARISDSSDRPVISATSVTMSLYTQSNLPLNSVQLRDDGIDPDLTKNDGVYSAYIPELSPDPSFHMGEVTGTLSLGDSLRTVVVNSVRSGSSAALVDSRLGGKCCGREVPPVETFRSLRDGRITSTLPGFRTTTPFEKEKLPPSRIGAITVINDNDETVRVEFLSPRANLIDGRVSHYETCCSYEEDATSCATIDPVCAPVDPDTPQQCDISKVALARLHVDWTGQAASSSVHLTCRLRGVNGGGIPGQESAGSLVVRVNYWQDVEGECPTSLKLANKCLPLYLFWIMIGCIAALLLAILIISICWCVSARRKKRQSQGGSREKVLMGTVNTTTSNNVHQQNAEMVRPKVSTISNSVPLQHTPTPTNSNNQFPVANVYVNKAYIQDSDGQMTLVASDGQLVPMEGDHPPFPADNASDITYRSELIAMPLRTMTNNRSSVVPQAARNPIYVEKQYHPPANPLFGDRDSSHYALGRKMQQTQERRQPPPKPVRPSQLFATAPTPKHRTQRPDSGYANNNNQQVQVSKSVPNNYGKVERQEAAVPVYASVSRGGRRTPGATTPTRSTSGYSSSFKYDEAAIEGFSTFRPKPSPKPPIPPFTKSQSLEHLSNKPNKRYDAFPSEDSDVYSDMSRGVAPTPAPPTTMPPPPHQRGKKPTPPPYRHPPQPSKQTHSHNNKHASDDEFDEDSDNWDNEEYDFHNPGVGASYA